MSIRELRKNMDLTQEAFAARLGIPKRTIQDWEGGKRTPPDYVIDLISFALEHGYTREADK